MNEFLVKLFDTADFPARWYCGRWSAGLGWLHIGSDLAIFGAYAAIPTSIAVYVLRKQQDVVFPKLYWLFALFIFSCGFGHLIEATIFWHPWYRFSGVVKLITATASWATVIVLVRALPAAMALPGQARLNKELKHEIEERKRAEDEMRQAKEEAEQANNAKDRFLAVLSHELRTPLNPIALAICAWERDATLPEHFRQDIGIMRRNIGIEVRLIEDLLDLTAITHGKLNLMLAPADAHELLRYAAETLAPEIQGKPVRLSMAMGATRSIVQTDRTRLMQILWNLLRNAIKFTPAGGEVNISTVTDGEDLRISITDTGMGISPEILPCIFDAFEQGRPEITKLFGGLGIGLTVVKGLVELLGGNIAVHSEGTGRGATFTVTLKCS